MAVPCPPLEWPPFLEECGPAEDPSILLTGRARIGGASAAVVAVRIAPGRARVPDYREGVPDAAYETSQLETILEELECLAQEIGAAPATMEAGMVQLATGTYVMGVLPGWDSAGAA
jgi:hypothetical protein